jgi:hypothetical protein
MAVPSSRPRWRRGGIRMWQLWRHATQEIAIPRAATVRYAELREAERYRDSLAPGSADWEGAAAVVARARRAYDVARPGTH